VCVFTEETGIEIFAIEILKDKILEDKSNK